MCSMCLEVSLLQMVRSWEFPRFNGWGWGFNFLGSRVSRSAPAFMSTPLCTTVFRLRVIHLIAFTPLL